MAFIANRRSYIVYLVLWSVFIASPLSSQSTFVVVDDLPVLSTSETKGDCTPIKYVTVSDKFTLSTGSTGTPSWIRARLAVSGTLPQHPWHLIIFDANGNQVQNIDGLSAFQGSPRYWTHIVIGSSLTVKLVSADPIDGLRVCIDRINIPRAMPGITSVINNHDDRQDLVASYGKTGPYHIFGEAVAMIQFIDPRDQDGSESNCTGFSLTPTLIITNNHCINDATALSSVSVTFDFETGNSQPFTAEVSKLAYGSSKLDFSILRIDRGRIPFAHISLDSVAAGTKLVVIQHPMAKPKMIAVLKCKAQSSVAAERPTDFFHLCDTSGGSSGSPVMDQTSGLVFGLHHLGATDPKRKDYHNMAVYFSQIMTELREAGSPLYAEIATTQGITTH